MSYSLGGPGCPQQADITPGFELDNSYLAERQCLLPAGSACTLSGLGTVDSLPGRESRELIKPPATGVRVFSFVDGAHPVVEFGTGYAALVDPSLDGQLGYLIDHADAVHPSPTSRVDAGQRPRPGGDATFPLPGPNPSGAAIQRACQGSDADDVNKVATHLHAPS